MPTLTPRLDRNEQNLIINGNFDFWQRGTTVTVSSSSNTYLADRFRFSVTSGYNMTYSQSTDVPTVAQSGYSSQFSAKIVNNSVVASPGATDQVSLYYFMEGYDYQTIHAKKVRLQFWVKSDLIGTYSVHLRNAGATRSYIASYSILVANTWEKKTIDVQMDSVGTWAFDNTRGLIAGFSLVEGTSNQTTTGSWQNGNFTGATGQANFASSNSSRQFLLSQVMLIPQDLTSSSSTDVVFSRAGRTIQQELAMCQRYYEKSYFITDPPATPASGIVDCANIYITGAGLGIGSFVSYKVTKRVNPPTTVRLFDTVGTVGQVTTQAAAGGTTNRAATLSSSNASGFAISVATSDPRIQLSFDSDAEL